MGKSVERGEREGRSVEGERRRLWWGSRVVRNRDKAGECSCAQGMFEVSFGLIPKEVRWERFDG